MGSSASLQVKWVVFAAINIIGSLSDSTDSKAAMVKRKRSHGLKTKNVSAYKLRHILNYCRSLANKNQLPFDIDPSLGEEDPFWKGLNAKLRPYKFKLKGLKKEIKRKEDWFLYDENTSFKLETPEGTLDLNKFMLVGCSQNYREPVVISKHNWVMKFTKPEDMKIAECYKPYQEVLNKANIMIRDFNSYSPNVPVVDARFEDSYDLPPHKVAEVGEIWTRTSDKKQMIVTNIENSKFTYFCDIWVDLEYLDGTGETSCPEEDFLNEFERSKNNLQTLQNDVEGTNVFKKTKTKKSDDVPYVGEIFISLNLKKAVTVKACSENMGGYKVRPGVWVCCRVFGDPSDCFMPLAKFHKKFQRPHTLKDYIWRRIHGKHVIADVKEFSEKMSILYVSYAGDEGCPYPELHEISIGKFFELFQMQGVKQKRSVSYV